VVVVLKRQHTGLSMLTQGGALRADAFADQATILSSIRASHGTGVLQVTDPSSVAATLSPAGVPALRGNPAVAEVIPDSRSGWHRLLRSPCPG
jgi:hypothetical protein